MPSPAPSAVLTDRDLLVLQLLAEHRIGVSAQVAHWLGVTEKTAARRLTRLREAGLVEHRRLFQRGSPMVRITGDGLRRIGSDLGRPGQKLDEYRHDVGVGWLWTAAREGAFGELSGIHTERALRSRDARVDRMPAGERPPEEELPPGGIGINGFSRDGRPERHYPDLLLESRAGHQVAVELELSNKGRRRLERVMDHYASDPRVDAILYVVPDPAAARRIREAAIRAGINDRVFIRGIAQGRIGGVVAERTAGRARSGPAPAKGRDTGTEAAR